MTNQEFIKHANNLLLASKGNWYQFTGTVNGRDVQLKGYGTWLQVYRVAGVNQITTMDNSVSNFKLELLQGLK